MRAMSSAGRKGLRTKSSAPMSKALETSSSESSAVSTRTGRSAVRGLVRRARSTANPSGGGMTRSRSTSEGVFSASQSSAADPEVAMAVFKPAARSVCVST